MSFWKARSLLQLVRVAQGRFSGISLAEICEHFDVDHRTAQRMVRALEDLYPSLEIRINQDQRRRWKLPAAQAPDRGDVLRERELAELETGIVGRGGRAPGEMSGPSPNYGTVCWRQWHLRRHGVPKRMLKAFWTPGAMPVGPVRGSSVHQASSRRSRRRSWLRSWFP